MRMKTRAALNMLPTRLRRFAEGEQGVTAIEFALVLPVVLLILLGCFEVPRYVLIYQKIARTSAGIADLVAQADEPLTKNQMEDIFIAGETMMEPYDLVAEGRVYVSSINNPAGAGVKVTWQRQHGSLGAGSAFTEGEDNPTLPAGLVPASNEEVLVAEVFFTYTPIFSNLIYSGSQLTKVSYTRPRNKNLMTKPPLQCPPGVDQC